MAKTVLQDVKGRKRFKWHYLCFFLAGCYILANLASLSLNHFILRSYSGSVEDISLWSNRLSQYSKLNELALEFYAPGNDAFHAGDLTDERRRLAHAYQAIQYTTTAAHDELRNSKHSKTEVLLEQFDRIDEHSVQVNKDASALFTELEKKNQQGAVTRLYEMNRSFSLLLRSIGTLCSDVQAIQTERINAGTARAKELSEYDFAIASTVCLLLCMLALFGRKLAINIKVGNFSSVSMPKRRKKKESKQTNIRSKSQQLQQASGAGELINCRVLIAEDGPNNQRFTSFVLKKAGADVTVVDDGQAAFDLVMKTCNEGTPFDVIVMDMQMPVLDGYQASSKLRAADYKGWIIAMTANNDSGDREKCLEAGCNDYIAKPFEKKQFISLVAKYATQQVPNQLHQMQG